MSESEINWNTELRKVERELAGLPPEPSADQVRVWRLEDQQEQRRRDAVNGAVGAWTRLFLVIALAGGLYFWPYARACGPGPTLASCVTWLGGWDCCGEPSSHWR